MFVFGKADDFLCFVNSRKTNNISVHTDEVALLVLEDLQFEIIINRYFFTKPF